MKVLHLIPSLNKGGAERLCLDIVRALRKIDKIKAVELAILYNKNEYTDEYPDIEPIIINSRIKPSITSKWTINLTDWNNLLESFNPDIIHTHLFEADFLARYEIRPGVNYISHCHDNMHQLARLKPTEWFKKKRLSEWYERKFMIKQYKKSLNKFIAISRDTETYFKENLPDELESHVKFLPNAIDISRYTQKKIDKTVGSPVQLINIGSFIEIKNQAFLLDVLLILKQKGINALLHFVGDGPLRSMVEEKSKKLDLQKEVIFHGKISHVESLLGENHLYVHSALKEAFGLVLLEAMAAGLPVVCLDAKGNRDLIEDGKNGYILSEANTSLFAEKITTISSNPAIYKSMSFAAKEKAAQYDIEPYVSRLLEIYTLKAVSKNG